MKTNSVGYLATDYNGLCDRAALYAGSDKVCPVCGSDFTVPLTSLWTYKLTARGKSTQYYCRYSCWRKAARER